VAGRPPKLKWLRIWGCKTYALKPIAERRKDFDDKPLDSTLKKTLDDIECLFQSWIKSSHLFIAFSTK
jgi:hypothetical protein